MKKPVRSAAGVLLVFALYQAAYAHQPALNQKEYLFYNLTAFIFFSIAGIIAETVIAYIFFIKNAVDWSNIKYVIIVNIITFPLYYFCDYLIKDYFMMILHDRLIYMVFYITGEIAIIFFEAYFLYVFCKKQLKYHHFLLLSIIMNSMSLVIGTAASVLGMYFLEMHP
jgi:hypothetical protein